MSTYKIALGAGHGANTPGKRCMKALDPNETREWWLNDRIADYVESYLRDYTGYELLRLDDSDDGAVDVDLQARVKKANSWGADFYLSIHHNAGVNGGKGGGIVAYSYKEGTTGATWRDAFYEELIAATGLKGNRYDGTLTAGFYVIKYTKMPAVLLELGFMDSKTDVPIILTNTFAQQCARAITNVLVERGGLKKKATAPKEETKTPAATTVSKVEAAKSGPYSGYSKAWTVNVDPDDTLNMRAGAGVDKPIICTLERGETFRCYGYYTEQKDGTVWLYGVHEGKTGFCSKRYLK